MANEAVLVFKTQEAIPFTVADGTGIEKGALLKMTDPMTAIISSAQNNFLAGIAASEKVASDGKIKLGVYRQGVFKMSLSGSVTVGEALSSADTNNWPNYCIKAGITCSGATVLGHALETGVTGDTILVAVNVGSGGNQQS